MANINHLVRRKQNLYLLLVALGLSSIGGGGLVYVGFPAGSAKSRKGAARTTKHDRGGLADVR